MKTLLNALLISIFMSVPFVYADECMQGDCEDGVGTGFTEEGKIYEGQWHNGLPHGKGKLTISKEKFIVGIWEAGKLKEKIEIP